MRVERNAARGPHAACDVRAIFMLLRTAFPPSLSFFDSLSLYFALGPSFASLTLVAFLVHEINIAESWLSRSRVIREAR